MVSGTISLAYEAFFSPFPHGTGPLSVMNEYLALPDGAGVFARDFSGTRATLDARGSSDAGTRTGLSPSLARLSSPLPFVLGVPIMRVHTPARPKPRWFGLIPFRSPLLGESPEVVSFPPATEMFQFAGFASLHLCVRCRMTGYNRLPGFPIRIPTDQGLRAASRGFSQLITSFIACSCQGIHHAPFSA